MCYVTYETNLCNLSAFFLLNFIDYFRVSPPRLCRPPPPPTPPTLPLTQANPRRDLLLLTNCAGGEVDIKRG